MHLLIHMQLLINMHIQDVSTSFSFSQNGHWQVRMLNCHMR
jgi:hypothetical protein